ncbi:hypothetical protein [Mycobacterium heckeshornense]|uniref:hypothetical protein n=1 Tax=Mycobacterium heckeshornense TaxID=110505 RepID=UPI00066299E5|nr:hypothetical protein [Mycobacterium heckeshornense]KMV14812.1 hypothetical protein ACT16_23265 [Mycobacterium heckeshornense]
MEPPTTSAADCLIAYLDAEDPYDYRLQDVQDLQLEAADARLQEVRDQMAVLGRRAEDSETDHIRVLADIVPLMFSDATYKSYPESFLTQGKWNALAAWLDALSTSSGAADVDMTGVQDIDDWLARLRQNGHFVYVSSGTSGRCSILQVSDHDRQLDLADFQTVWRWKAGAKPDGNHPVFALFPSAGSHRMVDTFGKIVEAFGRPDATYYLSDQPLLVAEVNRLCRLNKSIAQGTASPSEIEAMQAENAAKRANMAEIMARLGEAVYRHRDEPSVFVGTWGAQLALAQAAKAAGLDAGVHPDSLVQVGGGLKGTTLPDDYREQHRDILRLDASRYVSLYGMTELTTFLPECSGGRYHYPPWVIPLVLDKLGESVVEPENGELTGRLGFFDLSLEGHWGALVSGDQGTLRVDPCTCGRPSPSLGPDIVRFKDLPGGDDKVTCTGTIDTYVRGIVAGANQ